MNSYQVCITYQRGVQTLEQFFNVEESTSYFAKVEAKRLLNRQGIFGTFQYKVYGGNKVVDTSNQVF